MEEKYKEWLALRKKSTNEEGEQLCYCGHTKRCDCGDPDLVTFKESLSRGDIILDDPNNGWKSVNNAGGATHWE
jgi:hypothetical protein